MGCDELFILQMVVLNVLQFLQYYFKCISHAKLQFFSFKSVILYHVWNL